MRDDSNPQNSPQNHNFPLEKSPSFLSISIDDTDIGYFYREYYSMVFKRCLFILHNEKDAEDMAHEVFAKIQRLKNQGKLKIDYPKTYLSTAARNMSINKKIARKQLNEIYDMATKGSLNWFSDNEGRERELWESSIIDTVGEQEAAQNTVNAILDEQDEMTRSIYFYYYRDEMTLKEIGKLLGVSKSTVHNRIKALENQVKQKMGRAGK